MRKWGWLIIASLVLIFSVVLITFRPMHIYVVKRGDASAIDIKTFTAEKSDHPMTMEQWVSWWTPEIHRYYVDSVAIYEDGVKISKTWIDYYDFGSEVRSIIDSGTIVPADCEDGAIEGTTDMLAAGEDAWLSIGWVKVAGMWYGHAWIEVNKGGEWYIIETTTPNAMAFKLNSRAGENYRLAFRCNAKTIIRNDIVGSPYGSDPVPPELVSCLITQIDFSN